jgi:hypothetical protein
MRQRAILVALGFALFAVPEPLPAMQLAAAQAISPISCEIETTNVPAAGDAGEQAPVLSGVAVTFMNHGTAPIIDATFAFTYDGHTTIAKDVGTFTPGAEVRHRFPLVQRELTASDIGCRIVEAHYSAIASSQ